MKFKPTFTQGVAIAGALVITLYATAFACPPGGEHPRPGMAMPPPFAHGGEPWMPLLRELDLTQAQEDAVFERMHAQAPQMRRLMRTLHEQRAALRDLALAEGYDEAAAAKLTAELGATESALTRLRTDTLRGVSEQLTPEQRTRFKAAAQEERRGPGRPFGPGGNRPECGPFEKSSAAQMRDGAVPPALARYLELHGARDHHPWRS